MGACSESQHPWMKEARANTAARQTRHRENRTQGSIGTLLRCMEGGAESACGAWCAGQIVAAMDVQRVFRGHLARRMAAFERMMKQAMPSSPLATD